jgi:hypothetical protein
VGDYVHVKMGIFTGSVGWVAQVEQRPDADIVTAEFNDSGIKSYIVKLEPANEKVAVDASHLVPQSVIELYHKRTELTKSNQIQPRLDTCVCQIQ